MLSVRCLVFGSFLEDPRVLVSPIAVCDPGRYGGRRRVRHGSRTSLKETGGVEVVEEIHSRGAPQAFRKGLVRPGRKVRVVY